MDKNSCIKMVNSFCYQFWLPNTADIKKEIYLLDSPEYSNHAECVFTTTEAKFEIKIPDISYRPYFGVLIGQQCMIMAERSLPVDGMNNFRDMGGYETKDGFRVKWGKLYRSDHIYNATENGIQYLKQLGIHTIIDYRSPDERKKYPNKIISQDIKTYCVDPSAHTAELAAQFTSSKDSEDENLVNKIISQKEKGLLINRYDIVMEQYHNFVFKKECKEAFGKMLKIAADPKSAAIVQHCRGGKDRTGFGSMLLLGLLGVKKEDLVEDYMLTHYNRTKRNQVKMDIYRKFTNDPVVLEYLYSLIDTREEFIETPYDIIINNYGSFEKYVQKELDITSDDVLQLKKNYLE